MQLTSQELRRRTLGDQMTGFLTYECCVTAHGSHSASNEHAHVGCRCNSGGQSQRRDDYKKGVRLQAIDDSRRERPQTEALELFSFAAFIGYI